MITDCFGVQQWDLSDTETIFVHGVLALLKILTPVAICAYTWRVCRTARAHHRSSLLGLEEKQRLPHYNSVFRYLESKALTCREDP